MSWEEATAPSRLARTLQNSLRNGDQFAVLQAQLMALTDKTVWFEPDQVSGWTFLHFCASTDLPSQHWQWILEQCPVNRSALPSPFTSYKTALGETVVDIFFQHRLGNLKWQSANSQLHAKRLLAVLVNCDQTVISALPSTGVELVHDIPLEISTLRPDIRVAWMFLRDLFLLLEKTFSLLEEPFEWMTALARIGPSVPVIVAEWMKSFLNHTDESSSTEQALTKRKALHILCQTKPLAHMPRQAPSLLHMCMTMDGANMIIPETGRLPIEEALRSGWSFEGVYDLWKMTTKFVSKQFPLFIYPSLNTVDDTTIEILARHKRGAFSVYCWHMSSETVRESFMEAARNDYELERLSSMFDCLRASPSSLQRYKRQT